MTDMDAHDLRMAMGNNAMTTGDAIDDEGFAMIVATQRQVAEFVDYFKGCGLPSSTIHGMVSGLAIGLLFKDR